MTVAQYEARLAMIREVFDDNTKKLENAEKAGQSVPKTTSVAFSQPKPSLLASVRPIDKSSSHPPCRPAKRHSDVIDADSSDGESSGSFPPPRKARKTTGSQTAPGIARPWDQDHSKMKKPPRISLSGVKEGPESTSSSSKNKTKAPRVSINAHIELSAEQKGVLQLVLQGQNVFFTGSAGEATNWELLRAPNLFNRHRQVRIT